MELLIIADDFTGALDAASPFGKRGIPTMVFSRDSLPSVPPHIRVVAINTDTRHAAREQAYRRILTLAQACRAQGIPRIFKKIDSALRGNWAAEVQALLDAGLSDRLYLIPAYPDGGRTTENGLQLLHGQPVCQSAYGRDPFEPVTASRLGDYFATHTISVSQVAPLRSTPGIHLVDAVSNGQLAARCRELSAFGCPLLLAGSAGLAAGLAQTMPLGGEGSARFPQKVPRLLIVSGSLHPVSRGQTAYAQHLGCPCVTLTPEAQPRQITDAVLRGFARADAVILQTAPQKEALPPGDAARQLAELVAQIYAGAGPMALAVFGGDTLLQISNTLLEGGLCPIAEVEPGVPISIARDRSQRSLLLISKSGGFGSRAIISKMLSQLQIPERTQSRRFDQTADGFHASTIQEEEL